MRGPKYFSSYSPQPWHPQISIILLYSTETQTMIEGNGRNWYGQLGLEIVKCLWSCRSNGRNLLIHCNTMPVLGECRNYTCWFRKLHLDGLTAELMGSSLTYRHKILFVLFVFIGNDFIFAIILLYTYIRCQYFISSI